MAGIPVFGNVGPLSGLDMRNFYLAKQLEMEMAQNANQNQFQQQQFSEGQRRFDIGRQDEAQARSEQLAMHRDGRADQARQFERTQGLAEQQFGLRREQQAADIANQRQQGELARLRLELDKTQETRMGRESADRGRLLGKQIEGIERSDAERAVDEDAVSAMLAEIQKRNIDGLDDAQAEREVANIVRAIPNVANPQGKALQRALLKAGQKYMDRRRGISSEAKELDIKKETATGLKDSREATAEDRKVQRRVAVRSQVRSEVADLGRQYTDLLDSLGPGGVRDPQAVNDIRARMQAIAARMDALQAKLDEMGFDDAPAKE